MSDSEGGKKKDTYFYTIDVNLWYQLYIQFFVFFLTLTLEDVMLWNSVTGPVLTEYVKSEWVKSRRASRQISLLLSWNSSVCVLKYETKFRPDVDWSLWPTLVPTGGAIVFHQLITYQQISLETRFQITQKILTQKKKTRSVQLIRDIQIKK